MNINKFNNNPNNDEDSKKLKDIIGRNQTRKLTPPFSYGENQSEETIEENEDSNQALEKKESSSDNLLNQKSLLPSMSSIIGNNSNKEEVNVLASILGFNRKKIIFILIPVIAGVVLLFLIITTLIGSSSEDRTLSKDMIKKFSSITNDNDKNKIDASKIDTTFPPIGDMDFESYFNSNIKDYLINYLSQNGYCDEKDCTESDAYTFFKRYLEVVIAFEKEGYSIDSGLVYETIAYNRSDDEMFTGSTKKEKVNGWFAWIKSLFQSKTDEISKLSNKFWREKNVYEDGKVVSTEWEFSINKYLAYLMYGDSMHDISGLGTDNDLDIEGVNSKTSGTNGNVINGKHTYTYGQCSFDDSDYEGVIEEGYIYNRFKDTPILSNITDSQKLEKKIVLIIQAILDKTIEMYGNPSYCSVYNGGTSTYGTNVCTYSIGEKTYSNLKIQLLTCEYKFSDAKPVEGEEIIDFEKYITGVVYQENGGGSLESLKVQAIAARTYTLTRRKITTLADGTQVIQMRSCSWDQVYCNPDEGCWSDGSKTTVHSGYDPTKTWSRKPLPEDSIIRKATNAVAGQLLVDSSGKLVSTSYNNTVQKAWNSAAAAGKDYVSILLEHYKKASDIKKGTCESVGATVSGISKSERMKYLFPNGVPTSESQMQQYLTTIEVPINNEKGQKTTMKLTVHKKLAASFIQAFTEVQKTGFKIKKSSTAAYNWRKMETDSSKQSYHSYGSAIDVNWNDNPLVKNGKTGNYLPGINPYSVTQEVVNIFKKNGFYWGGDWTSYKDYMHFTYTNN